MDQETVRIIVEGLLLIVMIYIAGVLQRVIKILLKLGDDVNAIASAVGGGNKPIGKPGFASTSSVGGGNKPIGAPGFINVAIVEGSAGSTNDNP